MARFHEIHDHNVPPSTTKKRYHTRTKTAILTPDLVRIDRQTDSQTERGREQEIKVVYTCDP